MLRKVYEIKGFGESGFLIPGSFAGLWNPSLQSPCSDAQSLPLLQILPVNTDDSPRASTQMLKHSLIISRSIYRALEPQHQKTTQQSLKTITSSTSQTEIMKTTVAVSLLQGRWTCIGCQSQHRTMFSTADLCCPYWSFFSFLFHSWRCLASTKHISFSFVLPLLDLSYSIIYFFNSTPTVYKNQSLLYSFWKKYAALLWFLGWFSLLSSGNILKLKLLHSSLFWIEQG